MNKIVKIEKAIKISQQLQKQKKSIVLSGGCFDILHIGHIKFLENAKKEGDVLFVLLENDDSVKKLKGKNRPINNQENRAIVLSALRSVDFIIMLTKIMKNDDYDKLILQIQPKVIAATNPDPHIEHKKRQAKIVNARVAYVTKKLYHQSTTSISNLAKGELL